MPESELNRPASSRPQATLHGRDIGRFVLWAFGFSWIVFFAVDAWLIPKFRTSGSEGAVWLTAVFGHLLAMLGPGLAAIRIWRSRGESMPPWRWSRPRYYALAAAAMLALWALPAALGIVLVGSWHLRSPVEPYIWIAVLSGLSLLWIGAMGEELGWCAFLLPRLAQRLSRSRALVVSGIIRGLWHWPVLVSPLLVQVIAGEKSVGFLLLMSLAVSVQLAVSNVFFSALFGWIWYETESLPLVAWSHQWFDAARDISALLVIGFSRSLWFTLLWAFLFYPVAGMALRKVMRSEGLSYAALFSRKPPA